MIQAARQRLGLDPPTKDLASSASFFQSWGDSGLSSSHSFMTVPGRGSKGRPSPEATSDSTRSRGSLTTNRPRDESVANILPPTLSAEPPKPVPFWSTFGR